MIRTRRRSLAQMHDGMPSQYPTITSWLLSGIRRQGLGTLLIATAAGWSGIWLVLWIASLAGIAGAIAGVVGANSAVPGLFQSMFGPSGSVLGLVVGAVMGLIGGTLGALGTMILASPVSFFISIAGGALLSYLIVVYLVWAEDWIMVLRGYRRLSNRERARLDPILRDVARRMGLATTPRMLIADDGSRHAATYLRHIVIGKLLFDEVSNAALAGILAHELHHWNAGDTLGLKFVFASAMPVILFYDLGALLTQTRNALLMILGWAVLWPAWVIMHLLIEPLVAARSRTKIEYECDAKVENIGYGEGLIHALMYFGDFEKGSSGWLQVLSHTHPPIELRLEQLMRNEITYKVA